MEGYWRDKRDETSAGAAGAGLGAAGREPEREAGGCSARHRAQDGGSRGGFRQRSTQAQGCRAGRAARSNSSSRGNEALTKAHFPNDLEPRYLGYYARWGLDRPASRPGQRPGSVSGYPSSRLYAGGCE